LQVVVVVVKDIISVGIIMMAPEEQEPAGF
jgi:hypothetical protein